MSKTTPQIQTPSKIIKPEDITVDHLHHFSKESFPLWAVTSGIEVDNNIFDFETHRYLLPIYADSSKEIVWQKAAQLGATVYILLRALWWLEKHQGRKAGLYFPTKEGVDNLSADRLTPLIQSCPSLDNITSKTDKLSLRKIGKSSFYLMHLGGTASKDSTPLDYVSFDEVRLCSARDIDQALERISHSPYKYKVFMSTAGIPEQDIAARYNLGTMHQWRARCGCPDGVSLARAFPDCVVDDPKRGLYLRCPKCKYVIKDPQNGRYVPENPNADYNSYHVSQLVSKYISLKEIWDFYKRTSNLEEFYNAKLGLPYVDEQNRGVTKEQLRASVNTDISWENKNVQEGTAMGVDQGGGYLMVTIADLDKNSRKKFRHVEIIEMTNPVYYRNNRPCSPFVRLAELMEEFNVRYAVVDAMPNYNEALEFAQQFPGRVYLAWYSREAKDAVSWNDKKKHKDTVRKAGPLLRFKYTVALSRYLSMNVALGAWKNGEVYIPAPEGLLQTCRDEKTNQLHPESPAERLFDHLTRLIRRFKIVNEETGEGKYEWIYAGGDPHLAHAWNYCNVALERLKRRAILDFI